MRSFEDRIAEINRRSEKILKERKKRRKHILMACIPLVLCITLFAAFPRDTKTAAPKDPAVTKPPMNAPAGGANGSSNLSVLRIDVSGLDFSQSYTDTTDVMLIYDQLCSYSQCESESFEEPTEAVQDGNYKENAKVEDDYDHISDSATTGYTITIVMQDGNTTDYYLAGNTLKNLTTGLASTLTHKQADELKDMLGIPNP